MIYIHSDKGSRPLCSYDCKYGDTPRSEYELVITVAYDCPKGHKKATSVPKVKDKYVKVANAKRQVYVEENLDVYYNEYRGKYKFVNTKERLSSASWSNLI